MLKLYTYPTCGFCEKVRQGFKSMGVSFQEINAEPGTEGSEALLRLGGKQQVPFLVDEAAGVFMYESMDILNYARQSFKTN